jgi:hypothetical protein
VGLVRIESKWRRKKERDCACDNLLVVEVRLSIVPFPHGFSPLNRHGVSI